MIFYEYDMQSTLLFELVVSTSYEIEVVQSLDFGEDCW